MSNWTDEIIGGIKNVGQSAVTGTINVGLTTINITTNVVTSAPSWLGTIAEGTASTGKKVVVGLGSSVYNIASSTLSSYFGVVPDW